MRDMMINNTIRPLTESAVGKAKPADPKDESFGKIIGKAINDVNKQMTESGKAVEALTSGASKDIHGTMITMEKASVSFQLISQVRNKIIDAYKEIQRMSF